MILQKSPTLPNEGFWGHGDMKKLGDYLGICLKKLPLIVENTRAIFLPSCWIGPYLNKSGWIFDDTPPQGGVFETPQL